MALLVEGGNVVLLGPFPVTAALFLASSSGWEKATYKSTGAEGPSRARSSIALKPTSTWIKITWIKI